MRTTQIAARTDEVEARPPDILARMDAAHTETCRIERERLRAILESDRHELWRHHGCRDHAGFLAARYGISQWKARRLIGAAYALEHLPLISGALSSGTLSLDKTVELTRFATPATEKRLVKWAARVAPGAIRRRADAETHISLAGAQQADSDRHLRWWWREIGEGLEIEARLPVAEGAAFIMAVDRIAKDLPVTPPEEGAPAPAEADTVEQRRADALALLCSARIGSDPDPGRATVVVEAPIDSLTGDGANASIAGGPVMHPRTAQRLACDSRLEVALHGTGGKVVGVGRSAREPSPWLRRQVLRRDSHTCVFPGCEMRRFLHLHHMQWWELNGPTDLENLRWGVTLDAFGLPLWFRPSGRRFGPGPAPPEDVDEPPSSGSTDDAPWPALWHLLQGVDHAVTQEPSTKRLLILGARRFGRVPALCPARL